MRKNILAKRILCVLALGSIYSWNLLPVVAAENIEGNADNNYIVTISDKNNYTSAYGIKKNTGDASNASVTMTGGTIDYRIYGGYSKGTNNDVFNNKVMISGGSIGNRVNGGVAIHGDVYNNEISLSNNIVTPNKDAPAIYGGYSANDGKAYKNKITIKRATVGTVTGGIGWYDVTENTVDIENSTASFIIGGDGLSSVSQNYSKSINNNTVTVTNTSVGKENSSGFYIVGGTAKWEREGYTSVNGNKVILSGNVNLVNAMVYGGHLGTSDTFGEVAENIIEIKEGAEITGHGWGQQIIGGMATPKNKIVNNNKIIIDGTIKDKIDVFAGGEGGSSSYSNTKIENNEIILKHNANVEYAYLYGSSSNAVKEGRAENNDLTIDNWEGEAYKLANFQNVNFSNITLENLDTAILSSFLSSDLTNTYINLTADSFSDDLDVSQNTKKIIVDGKNILFDENKINKSLDNEDIIRNDKSASGVRVHNADIILTNNSSDKDKKDISLTITRSLLAGKYIDNNGTEHINTHTNDPTLTLNETTSTNASVIAGSYASGNNAAQGGTLIIDGAYSAPNAGGNLYAGYSESGAVTDNAVFLNSANIGEINLYASNANATSHAGNSVAITGKNNFINSLNGFDAINFNNIAWENAGTVLTINNSSDTQESLSGSQIYLNSFSNANDIQANDSMLLIKGENLGVDLNNVHDSGFSAGVTTIGTGNAEITGEGLRYTVKEIKANPQLNLIAENRAVAAAFVNQGSDLIADGLASLAEQYNYGFKTFAAVYGNRSSYDVNDDLKINGWSDIVGFGSTHKTGAGAFDWGVFYENGTGNYRTYNNFNDEFFRGDGNLLYNGGGVAARLRRDDGFYYEGSLRVGALKSEMANAVKDGAGNLYGYESDSTYYGAHVGVGKIIDLGGAKELDVYGKYFHTYVDGDSFNIDGDKFSFDSVKSDRVRIGAQLTTNKNNKWSAVYGLAYEYEFSGDSDMRAAQFDLPTQSLEGGTVIGKIGLKFKDAANSPWSLDLNLTGYQGQRDGFSGMVQATYNF